MTWNLLFSILVLASAVASLPLDYDSHSSKNASNYNKENLLSNSSGDGADNTFVGDNEEEEDSSSVDYESSSGDDESSSDDEDKKTDGGKEKQPHVCTYNFTVVYRKFVIIKGELISYNTTIVINTSNCCEGYVNVGGQCRLDLCKDRVCQEDLQSKCVTLEWCGDLVPVFVTNTGIISDVCTQPNKAQERFDNCPNVTYTCQGNPHCSDEEAVCITSKCDCTPGLVWLQHNGKEAFC